ncbi:GcrA cell cycle regulator [Ensifer aridi]|uniref:GcrA cell cycle regulator n=1 Tax=Ensifer aridi TaxID=1708715 RepID=UPI000A10644C|nr:GcrA cell cycle regulator [Ensifer aridi]
MTIQHRTVDIEAASKLWKDEASQIAKRFGVTRSVIVGVAFRNRDRFPKREERKTPGKIAAPRVRKSLSAPAPAPEVDIPPTAYDAERLPSAKLLHELTAGQCRCSINNGGPYLFCAAETTGRYCRNHQARASQTRGTKHV